jgi:hypothetical protein
MFQNEWLGFAKAILARVPNATFGMPDIASNARWFAVLGDKLADDPLRQNIACMTHHYYIGGPPSDPTMTIERILTRDPRVAADAALVRGAAEKLHTAWRMTEGNTCYRGGKPGVSDVFAAALWSADYLLELASLGYAGVNLHGGDPKFIANSLGGKLPGDEVVHDDPALHPRPYYTPIAHIGERYVAEPVSFGMRFAQRFAGTTLLETELDASGVNASAYAARDAKGEILIAILNKDALQPLSLRLPAAAHSLETVTASSLSATEVRMASAIPNPGAEQTIAPYTLALFRLGPMR